jgi:voltage-gated potassium channel
MTEASSPPGASGPSSEVSPASIPRQLYAFLWRTSLMLLMLTCCYYVLPEHGLLEDSAATVRSGATLLALAGFALVLRIQLRARRTRPSVWTRAESLLTALYILILVFAIAYFRIAMSDPNAIAGISDRTDSLYFTVTTVATVGFGDIHAVSTGARLLVTIQMLINLVYVGTALRVLSNLRGFSDQGPSQPPSSSSTSPQEATDHE